MILLVSGIFLFTASQCNKEEVGPKGETGVKGETGPKGETGNANVISSGWFSIPTADWTYNGDGNSKGEVTVPELTQEVMDNAMIQVYIDLDAWSSVYSLPVTSSYYPVSFSIKTPGKLTIHVGGAGANDLMTYKYRYVIIPTSAMDQIPAGTDLTSYKAVSEVFNLD